MKRKYRALSYLGIFILLVSFQNCGNGLDPVLLQSNPVDSVTTEVLQAVDGTFGVEAGLSVSGQLKSSGSKQKLTFSILSPPTQGQLANFDPNTGFFSYVPTSGGPSLDKFTYQLKDLAGVTSEPGTISLNVTPVNLYQDWHATSVIGTGRSCNNGKIALTLSGGTLSVGQRSFLCGGVTQSFNEVQLTVNGSMVFSATSPNSVGTVDSQGLTIKVNKNAGSCGVESTEIQIKPVGLGFTYDEYVFSNCRTDSLHGTLKRGSKVSIFGDFNFGDVQFSNILSRRVWISNDGDSTSSLATSGVTTPFKWNSTGFYPGKDGTCTSSLSQKTACSIALEVGTSTTGTFGSNIRIDYTSGLSAAQSVIQAQAKVFRFALVSTQSAVDFGANNIGSSRVKVITLENPGTYTATNLSASFQTDKFQFSGGVFPGLTGTCTNQLDPMAKCLIEIAYPSSVGGLLKDTLTLNYFDGQGNKSTKVDLSGMTAEFHVVSFYSGSGGSFCTTVPGIATINVTGSHPKILILNSYESVRFTLNSTSEILKIYVLGGGPHRLLNVPSTIPVQFLTSRSYDNLQTTNNGGGFVPASNIEGTIYRDFSASGVTYCAPGIADRRYFTSLSPYMTLDYTAGPNNDSQIATLLGNSIAYFFQGSYYATTITVSDK